MIVSFEKVTIIIIMLVVKAMVMIMCLHVCNVADKAPHKQFHDHSCYRYSR